MPAVVATPTVVAQRVAGVEDDAMTRAAAVCAAETVAAEIRDAVTPGAGPLDANCLAPKESEVCLLRHGHEKIEIRER